MHPFCWIMSGAHSVFHTRTAFSASDGSSVICMSRTIDMDVLPHDLRQRSRGLFGCQGAGPARPSNSSRGSMGPQSTDAFCVRRRFCLQRRRSCILAKLRGFRARIIGGDWTSEGGQPPTSIISRSNVPELSKNIIQKGLALARDWSGTVAHTGSKDAQRSCPAGSVAKAGLRVVRRDAAISRTEDLKCQRLRKNHHLLRLFPSLPRVPRGRLTTIPRVGAPIRAPSNPASSRCCNHLKEQRLRL
jgi:hypothetical protein